MNTLHYPSLELCKKLTEIGFPETKEYAVDYHGDFVEDDNLVCPSIMEMLDVMPKWIQDPTGRIRITDTIWNYQLTIYGGAKEGEFNVWYHLVDGDYLYVTEGTLPNALAEMILWLHENNYISFSK